MRAFVKEISAHKFFENCRFTNKRFTFDHVASQTICVELAGGPTNIRDAFLNRMYEENREFDRTGLKAKKVRRVYDFLAKCFPEKTPELERYSVITLYCLVSLLIDGYVLDGLDEKLRSWFIGFEQERARQEHLPEEDRDIQLLEYRRLISQSTDAEESVVSRLEVMERRFFSAYPDIEPKDAQRDFTHEQRLAIYRRDEGMCQVKLKCTGEKVAWDHWHADHKIPHAKGGKTTVANGQVACEPCNLGKSSTHMSADSAAQ